MTRAGADVLQPAGSQTGAGADQAHEHPAERPQYRIRPQDDGGLWRGPTEAAWTTRILRGTRPPRPSPATPE
jgi:hypothetical protein